MTLSTTTNKVSLSGDGNTTVFAYNFKILSSSDLKVYIRSATGTETLKTITTHYTVSGVGSASGGNVTFTGGNTPTNTETVILQRVVPLTQTHDYVENDPFPAESHEQGLDRLTMHVQQLQEEIDRSIKASVSNTISSTEFTNDATDRANKLFAFDSAGNINIATTVGSNTGNWATATAYGERDIVKDTSTNNIFQCKTAHTSSGSQPLTSNADSAKWDLLVDAESATTSATNAQTSAVNSANSATASANSASASATSEANSLTHSNTASGHKDTALTHSNTASTHATNSSNSATASASSATSSATTLTNFEKQYLGSKSSAPTADNDGNTLDGTYEGTLYFNSTTDDLYVWNGSAWEQASFSAGGFMSQNNNLSDVANASTSRTNLGLGTASTLNVGTSANNVVQLDGNAKLPAVSGENLTGLSSGTDAIDMVIGSGSDAVTLGSVVTRESNGEAKKVKKVTTTQNLTLGSGQFSQAVGSGTLSGNPYMGHSSYRMQYTNPTVACANDSGQYIIIYREQSSRTRMQIFTYDSASSTWTVVTGNYQINSISGGNPVSGTNFRGGGSNFGGGTSLNYLRWHKNMNASAGGTWLIVWHYAHSAGNQMRYVTPFTVDSSNNVVMYSDHKLIARNDGQASGDDFFTSDTSIKSMTTDNCDFLSAGQHYIYYGWPYSSVFVISARRLTWGGSSYSISDLGTSTTNTINGNPAQLTSTDRPMRVMYDYTSGYLGVFWLDSNRRNRFTVWENTGNANSYTWSPKYTEQLTTDNNSGTFDNNATWHTQFQKADGKGRVMFSWRHTFYSPSSHYGQRFQCISMGASSLTIQTIADSGQGSSTYHDSPSTMMKYDFLNDRYLVPISGNIDHNGQSQSLKYYEPDGTGVSVEHSVSGGGQSGAYQFGHCLAMVDTMSITGITNANAGKWFQINDTDSATFTSHSTDIQNGYYTAGNIPHDLTTSTTNKSLSFGFAQKAGSAGDTISVLPFDSESIDQNQTSLTHDTKYYVSSTGALSTATTPDSDINGDGDNPLVGQAIGTTNIRLPSKSISAGSASSDTSKIFCGAVDLRETASQSNFTLSKPASLNASDIRSYVVEWYGVMTSNSSDYYVLQMKPYNSGSSVMSGTFYGTGFSYYYGQHGNFSNNHSTYLNLCYLGGESYNGTASSTRASTNINYSPSFNGQAVYENNINHASLNYYAYVRVGNNNNYMKQEWWTGGANNSATVSNYADSFYFEPRTGSWTEGVVSLYAITK